MFILMSTLNPIHVREFFCGKSALSENTRSLALNRRFQSTVRSQEDARKENNLAAD
jgi:hypothetical protein